MTAIYEGCGLLYIVFVFQTTCTSLRPQTVVSTYAHTHANGLATTHDHNQRLSSTVIQAAVRPCREQRTGFSIEKGENSTWPVELQRTFRDRRSAGHQ
jgi:hypothetical protein